MPPKHACFISYRHVGQNELLNSFLEQLSRSLSFELQLWLKECPEGGVYLDRERLQGGDFYNEALATALCESACMIMVFIPLYFDKDRPYCTREYKAMELLEKERLARLDSEQRTHGLIIPIILRGGNDLPDEIKEGRQYYDFQSFGLAGPELHRHPRDRRIYRGALQRTDSSLRGPRSLPGLRRIRAAIRGIRQAVARGA
jgi:hypothetical protein